MARNSPASKNFPKQIGHDSYHTERFRRSSIRIIGEWHRGQSTRRCSLRPARAVAPGGSSRSTLSFACTSASSSASNQRPSQDVHRSICVFSTCIVCIGALHFGHWICMECPHASGCQCKDDRAQTTCNEWISSVPCITSETERFADSSDDLSWRTRRINPERIGGLLECVELTLQERRPGI